MATKPDTLRLIYPQWQGGIVAHLLPELNPVEASQGYYLGAQLLNFLAPNSQQKTLQVPISLDMTDRAIEKGIISRQVIIQQTKAALDLLEQHKPGRVVTLGGDCGVSVVPFTYLSAQYPNDVAIVWIDAHPDLTLPYDTYAGYHGMALTACLGIGDEEIMGLLPAKVDVSKALIIGLRAWEEGMQERQRELGIKGLAPAAVSQDSSVVLDWLKATGASKVVIHFDLDVLEPTELIAAVGTDPDGMKIDEVLRLIQDIAFHYEVVGLTVAEHMPRVAIKLKSMLHQLPLLSD